MPRSKTPAKRSTKKSAPISARTPRSKTTSLADRAGAETELAQAKSPGDIRQAVTGREHEFWAIGFIACGILVGLAVYARLAGPVGQGADAGLGAAIGLGRYVLPVIFVAIGVALLRGDQPSARTRLIVGWGGILLAGLGVLHVARAHGPTPESMNLAGPGDGSGQSWAKRCGHCSAQSERY